MRGDANSHPTNSFGNLHRRPSRISEKTTPDTSIVIDVVPPVSTESPCTIQADFTFVGLFTSLAFLLRLPPRLPTLEETILVHTIPIKCILLSPQHLSSRKAAPAFNPLHQHLLPPLIVQDLRPTLVACRSRVPTTVLLIQEGWHILRVPGRANARLRAFAQASQRKAPSHVRAIPASSSPILVQADRRAPHRPTRGVHPPLRLPLVLVAVGWRKHRR
jgi:hypothetical protein